MRQPEPEVGAPKIVARYSGPNGVEVEVHDESRPYGYANLLHVRLRAVVRVPGVSEPYERWMERIGVPLDECDAVRAEFLGNFQGNVLSYLFSDEFPRRYADHLGRSRKKVIRFRGAP